VTAAVCWKSATVLCEEPRATHAQVLEGPGSIIWSWDTSPFPSLLLRLSQCL